MPLLLAALLPPLLPAGPVRAGGDGGGGPSPSFLVLPRGDGPLPPGRSAVVGLAGVDNGLARLELNGKVAGFAGVRGGAFLAHVNLPEGVSVLRVSAGAWTGEATLRAAAGAPYRTHPALEECDRCHGAAGGRPGWTVPPPVERACAPCHPGKSSGKHVHGPAALGQCTACHDPHGSPLPGLAKDGRGCLACHEPFPPGESVHRPAAEGRCNGCHDPHASPRRTHLVREGNLLCAGCHRGDGYHEIHRKAPEGGTSSLSVPDDFPRSGEELLCTGCHAPHRSDGKRLLREATELCRRCHPF